MRFNDRINRLRLGTIKAADKMAGIATISSGTTVASVAAAGISSGDLVFLQPYMYANAQTAVASGAQTFLGGLAVSSVGADRFMIFTVGSRAPIVDLPVGWFVVRK